MDLEKDEFEQELEAQNEGNFLELKVQKEEEIDKFGIKRIKKMPHSKYDLKVDLEKRVIYFYLYQPKIKLEEATESEKEKGYKQREVVEFSSVLVFKKEYSLENNIINIENKNYKIPEFFNSELIKKQDKPTMERVFYDILRDEIRLELKNYENR